MSDVCLCPKCIEAIYKLLINNSCAGHCFSSQICNFEMHYSDSNWKKANDNNNCT